MRRRTSSAWFQGYPKTGAPVMSISRCESKDAAEAFTRPGLLGERRSGGLLRKCGEVARYALLNERLAIVVGGFSLGNRENELHLHYM